jgi:signal transduction histidine kinase
MPEDVPLAEPADPLTAVAGSAAAAGVPAGAGPAGMPGYPVTGDLAATRCVPANGAHPPGPHAYATGTLWWDVYYGAVLAATLALAWVTSPTVLGRGIACAALAGGGVLYAAFGRRAIFEGGHSRQATLYLAGLAALVVLAESQSPESTWILFAVIPQCFMAAPLRQAIGWLTVFNLAPVAFLAEPARRAHGAVLPTVGSAAVSLLFSGGFGTWITRIIRQSTERAELLGRLQAAQAELAAVSHQAGMLAERQRLAGEIHDTLAQGLTSIVMLLQAAEAELTAYPGEAGRLIGLAAQAAREGLAEARAMVATLTPAHLENATLPQALRRLTERAGAELGISARFRTEGIPRPLSATAEVVLLRAGQEALANVRKRSAAAEVQVVLSYREQQARLEVTDDGTGFDAGQASGGYGLRGMRSRIVQAGGSLQVSSSPGAGTTVSVEVPG